MKAGMKFMFGAAALIAAGTLAAQEQTFNTAADWNKSAAVTDVDGLLNVKNRAMLSGKKFTVDPSKTYTIKFSVRTQNAQDNDFSWVLGGFRVFDKNGREISCIHVNPVAGTLTEVAADAAKGATVIQLKDASKFRNRSAGLVADAKEDFSDLPNRNLIGSIKEFKKNGEVWDVTLVKPLAKDIKAGTAVREHAFGGYLYTAGAKNVKGDWVTMTGTIKGMSEKGWSSRVWPVGTVSAQFIILVNWKNKQLDTQFKDVTFTVK